MPARVQWAVTVLIVSARCFCFLLTFVQLVILILEDSLKLKGEIVPGRSNFYPFPQHTHTGIKHHTELPLPLYSDQSLNTHTH